jgi:hypothetical protein
VKKYGRFWHFATLQAPAFDVRFQGIPDFDEVTTAAAAGCRYRRNKLKTVAR